jgi:hypothetical protein
MPALKRIDFNSLCPDEGDTGGNIYIQPMAS